MTDWAQGKSIAQRLRQNPQAATYLAEFFRAMTLPGSIDYSSKNERWHAVMDILSMQWQAIMLHSSRCPWMSGAK